jgi:HEAT repeat protein
VKTAKELLEMIRAATAETGDAWRIPLVTAINATAEPPVYRELATLLASEPEAVRAFAAQMLGDAGNPEVLETLEPLLRDASPRVRFSAAVAVAEYGAVDDMVPALEELIAQDARAQVRLLAVQSLFVIRDSPGALAALVKASADADPQVRAAAERILGQRTDVRVR